MKRDMKEKNGWIKYKITDWVLWVAAKQKTIEIIN